MLAIATNPIIPAANPSPVLSGTRGGTHPNSIAGPSDPPFSGIQGNFGKTLASKTANPAGLSAFTKPVTNPKTQRNVPLGNGGPVAPPPHMAKDSALQQSTDGMLPNVLGTAPAAPVDTAGTPSKPAGASLSKANAPVDPLQFVPGSGAGASVDGHALTLVADTWSADSGPVGGAADAKTSDIRVGMSFSDLQSDQSVSDDAQTSNLVEELIADVTSETADSGVMVLPGENSSMALSAPQNGPKTPIAALSTVQSAQAPNSAQTQTLSDDVAIGETQVITGAPGFVPLPKASGADQNQAPRTAQEHTKGNSSASSYAANPLVGPIPEQQSPIQDGPTALSVAANLLQAIAGQGTTEDDGKNPTGSNLGQNAAHSFSQSTGDHVSGVRATDTGKASSSDEQFGEGGNGASTLANIISATPAPLHIAPGSNQTATANTPQSQALQLSVQTSTSVETHGLAAASNKTTGNPTELGFQPQAASTLPRSLSDVAQASQLYQGVGRAEMRIAVDTDAFGAIDLRAVLHQGNLSATIGVQRADVQTLLVNQLPALQHSLADKNLQVTQISVLAGSIGDSGSGQPQEQRDREVPSAASGQVVSEDHRESRVLPKSDDAAEPVGYSMRLSVIA